MKNFLLFKSRPFWENKGEKKKMRKAGRFGKKTEKKKPFWGVTSFSESKRETTLSEIG